MPAPVRVQSFTFSHNTPSIVAGLNTGIVALMGAAVIRLDFVVGDAWDGTHPYAAVGNSQASAVANASNPSTAQDLSLASGVVRNWSGLITSPSPTSLIMPSDLELWLAVQSSGGGDPGATTGTGIIHLVTGES